MKECPVCHKPIRENARFCLHCMSVLSPKKSPTHPLRAARLLPLLYAFLVFALLSGAGVGLCSLFWGENEAPLKDPIPTEETEGDSEGKNASHDPSESHTVEDSSETEDTPDEGAAASTSQTSSTTAGSSKTSSTTGKATSKATTTTKKATTTTSTPTATTKPSTPSTPVSPTVDYKYRRATASDFSGLTPREGMVITGIQTLSSDFSYVIPETIEGKPVVKIAEEAFSRFGERYYPNEQNPLEIRIRSLTLPSTFLILDARAFSYALDVEELVVPKTVVIRGVNAFGGNRIGRLTLSLSTVELHMFDSCRIGQLTFGSGVETIRSSAFFVATIERYVSFPQTITLVEAHAFDGTAFLGNSYFVLPSHLKNTSEYVEESPFGLTKEIRWE